MSRPDTPVTSLRGLHAVLVSQVEPNPFNGRSFYDDEVVARLSREIRVDGQLVAAVGVPSSIAQNRFTLVDGHYRLRAIAAAGLKTIMLDVRDPVPNVELFRLSFALNEHRAPHTALDNALAWSRLLASGVINSQSDLRAITGKSLSTISKTLSMLELPTALLNIVKEHPCRITTKLGYALAQMCRAGSSQSAMRLAEQAISADISTAEIERAVINALRGKRVRRPQNLSESTYVRGSACVGTIKIWQSGRLSMELSFPEPSRASEFLEQLKHLVTLSN